MMEGYITDFELAESKHLCIFCMEVLPIGGTAKCHEKCFKLFAEEQDRHFIRRGRLIQRLREYHEEHKDEITSGEAADGSHVQ